MFILCIVIRLLKNLFLFLRIYCINFGNFYLIIEKIVKFYKRLNVEVF